MKKNEEEGRVMEKETIVFNERACRFQRRETRTQRKMEKNGEEEL